MTFGEDLDPGSAPAGSAFTVDGDRVSVTYTRPASGKRLRDLTGNDVESFTTRRVANDTPDAAPAFVAGGIRPGLGKHLSLMFTKALAGTSEPPDSAFLVQATSPSGGTRYISGAPGTANVNGNTVDIELASAVRPDETVTVSYRMPSRNALKDRSSGKAVESFRNKGVSNGPPRIRSMAIVSNPGTDRTYERGDTIRVAVTFTAPVVVDTDEGCGLPVPMRYGCAAATPARSPAASSRHLGGGACFIDEDELLRVEVGLGFDPGAPASQHVRALLLAGVRRFLKVMPRRWKKRHTVLWDTRRPCSSSRWVAISASVMSGDSSTSVRTTSARASIRCERLSPPCALGLQLPCGARHRPT